MSTVTLICLLSENSGPTLWCT